MKTNKLLIILAASSLVFGCQQEIAELTPPEEIVPSGTSGSANFTKYVSIGNSLTAGYQAGALFNEGQANSYPSIIAKQFAYVSANDPFDQPSINSVNGYYGMAGPLVLGRLILFDADGPTGPKTAAPTPSGFPGVPAPYNTGDVPTAFTGDKSQLNNFGVPGIILAQALTADTGNPASPAYNPLWARFASQPGVKSILQDALAQSPTFFTFWLGNNDILGYATSGGAFGGSGTAGKDLTPSATFQAQYTAAITALLANPNTKGAVATIPDVTSIPFFTTVKYNAIPMDATTAAAVNSGFAGFNQILSVIQNNAALKANFGLTSEDLEARKVSFSAAANNRILIADKTLTDLGPVLDYLKNAGQITTEQRAQLAPYQKTRQATSSDIITLSAGSVLGTTVGGNPLAVNGVSVALADQYVLLPSEILAVKNRTNEFNTIISNLVTANNTRLALVDVNAKFTGLVNGTIRFVDGMPVSATFIPPSGLFSEDGVHPNNRGSAYIAKLFIEAINERFGATVPAVNLSQFRGTAVPLNP